MSDELAPPLLAARFLPDMSDVDRENLRAAVSELFNHQAILKDLPGDRDVYEWARLHFTWVKEVTALLGFEVILNEDDQLIYALPGERSTLRRLRIEWTLVLLSLWYDYDVQLRAEGAPVIFTVESLNESLKTKLGDRMPALSVLKDILAFFASRKLIRMEHADDPAHSRVEVLPTIRFVLPFGELEKVSQALEELMSRPEGAEEASHG
jgi:hypothetical protein